MNEHHDNPAGRLAAILSRARELSSDVEATAGWGVVLGATDRVDLLPRVVALLKLVTDAYAAVEATPEGEFRDFHLQAFSNLNNFAAQLAAMHGTTMAIFRPYTSEAVVSRLQSASLELRRLGQRAPELTEPQLQELLDLVRSLVDEVTGSAILAPDAKLYILRLLSDVEAAINAYKIGGFGSITAAVAAVASGSLVVANEAERGWFTRLFRRLWGAATAHATGVNEIAESTSAVMDAIESARSLIP